MQTKDVSQRVSEQLRNRVEALAQKWAATPPSHEQYLTGAKELLSWRQERAHPGLFGHTLPQMLTATLDDGWGQGLTVIEALAESIGVRSRRIKLLATARDILIMCHELKPAFLGLTVLQFDTEPQLLALSKGLGDSTTVIAGGPVFRIDPQLQARVGIDHVAQSGAAFLTLMLSMTGSTQNVTGC